MNRMLDPYGLGYRPMMSDAEDVDTQSVVNRMNANQAYEQSPFGRVNAMLTRQTDALEGSSSWNPINMMLEGAKSANKWLGAMQYPEQVQTGDMLAPLGLGAMAAPFTRLRTGATRAAVDDRIAQQLIDEHPKAKAILDEPYYRRSSHIVKRDAPDYEVHHPDLSKRPLFFAPDWLPGAGYRTDNAMMSAANDAADVPLSSDRLRVVEPSSTSQRLYHGTAAQNFTHFRDAPWLTPNPDVASYYAANMAPEYPLARTSRVYPVEMQADKPFHMPMKDGWPDYAGAWKAMGVEPPARGANHDDVVKDALRERGYDHIVFDGILDHGGSQRQYLPLKEGTVKSSTTGETLFADQARSSVPGTTINALANDLPMDEASRMARAKEMGFDTDQVLHHGTRSDQPFDSFRPSERGALGPGVYFSGQPGVAARYGDVGDYMVRGNILNTKPNSRIPEDAIAAIKAGLTPEETSRWDRLWPSSGRADGETVREVLTRSVEGPRVVELLRKLGYDGVEGIADGHELSIFDPKNIRSVNAAFDPSKSDSANLLAADTARSSVPGTVVNAQGQEQDDPVIGILSRYGLLP